MSIVSFFTAIERRKSVQALKRALVSLIPLLMIGSLALVLRSFPYMKYQQFIISWLDGTIYNILTVIYNSTFGMLAVYMSAMIGYHSANLREHKGKTEIYGTLTVSMGAFFIMSGVPDIADGAFGPKGMFIAIVSATLASKLYSALSVRRRNRILLSDGSDVRLSSAIHTIIPAFCTLAVFAILNTILVEVFSVKSGYSLLLRAVNGIFDHIGSDFPRAICFILFSSVMWFFGIHGSDILEGVSESVFQPATQINIQLAESGNAPTEIFTKPFFDSFVLMGGCGVTMGLFIALIIFSRRSTARRLTRISLFPMIFNINEIMVFGLPIIYNPVFLIPFLAAPLFCFLSTFTAMSLGIVPMVTSAVEWTTPVLMSGYVATGSIMGALLQLVNLAACVAIYAPFVVMNDRKKAQDTKDSYNEMLVLFKKHESTREPIRLVDNSEYGWLAKSLAADLAEAFNGKLLELVYQPQFDSKGVCVGAEALTRWNHPVLGNIYPPLIFELADETDMLFKLEKWVAVRAVNQAKQFQKASASDFKVSVNVTGVTIQGDDYEQLLTELAETKNDLHFCIEITEQAALQLNDKLSERLKRIRGMGYILAVDDFSMGNTSIQYLVENSFDIVKLDGSLVGGIADNPRCLEIISSIMKLSDTLGVDVIAEYVSSEQIQKKLYEAGCHLYQGWFYSPAIKVNELMELLKHK